MINCGNAILLLEKLFVFLWLLPSSIVCVTMSLNNLQIPVSFYEDFCQVYTSNEQHHFTIIEFKIITVQS